MTQEILSYFSEALAEDYTGEAYEVKTDKNSVTISKITDTRPEYGYGECGNWRGSFYMGEEITGERSAEISVKDGSITVDFSAWDRYSDEKKQESFTTELDAYGDLVSADSIFESIENWIGA
ncbi:hypothetical protein [Suttonella ornithocola]|uniref:Uncharacterized protein n=1 Tax=Suttonella ornithocola TaxID=279832 RepID=A0A380MV07_9GAMM|nr:hypothetical protein [Suttonella ornithocola]SUO95207.1 Uncharacterised protein [Suttonella ornithocola]SUQ09765.1 Uncharacterised protein [Suttonella ornithocola]